MLSKSLNLLTPPLWHTPADKANASAWAVSLSTKWGPRGRASENPLGADFRELRDRSSQTSHYANSVGCR